MAKHRPTFSERWQALLAAGRRFFIPAGSGGDPGERLAERYLKGLKHRVIERNYRCPAGEIDLVTLEGDRVVFVEVKLRRSGRGGAPEEAVDRRKQLRVSRAAVVYLKERGWLGRSTRFDVVAVDASVEPPTIRHIVAAYEMVDGGQLW